MYVSVLRSLAEFCNFRQTLEVMLCDRIVCGINGDAIQRHLLTEPGFTYKKSLEIAQNLEVISQNMRELHPATSSSKKETIKSKINKVAQAKPVTKPQGKPDMPCYHCGKPGHKPISCHFKEAICHFCNKVGHLKSLYLSKKKSETQCKKKELQPHPVMTIYSDDATDTEDYPLYTLSSSSTPPIKVPVLLGGLPVEMELYMGTAFSLMAEANFQQLFPAKELAPTKIRMCTQWRSDRGTG